jgi:hypothetical protein
MKHIFYYRRLSTWDVITEAEYNALPIDKKNNYKFYGSGPVGYFNQKDRRYYKQDLN